MQYALLIHDDVARLDALSKSEMTELVAAYNAFRASLEASGAFRGATRLGRHDTATTVRVRQDDPLTTDGPFAETKEQLTGFFVVECENLDEALALAAKIPAARWGAVEVRPIHHVDTG